MPRTEADVIACLRRTADAVEVAGEWLLRDCIHVLGKAELPSGRGNEYTAYDYTAMDIDMAEEALDHFVWWLRRSAGDWEKALGARLEKPKEDCGEPG